MEDQNIGMSSSKDDVFLQKLNQIVLDNLENEQFGVSELSHQVGYSRSQLHRKLKVLQKKSASQFIREVRLEEAMKLLQNDAGTASEIGYQVGFSSAAYFSKCFHRRFGFPPGEVRKRMQNSGEATSASWDDGSSKKIKLVKSDDHRKFWQRSVFPAVIFLLATIFLINHFLYSGKNQQPSIAVLPLDNLSDLPENEYFSAGMQDALIGALGKLSGWRVISRTSTLQYKSGGRNLQDIAKNLDADLIVEGSVYGYDDSVRIQLQLIQTSPQENHLWAQEYHQDLANVLKMQSQVVKDIAQEIALVVSPEEEAHLISTRSVNPETYKAFLRGMYFVNKSTSDDFQKGIVYLNQAIEIDPADPLAYAGLAMGYIMLGHGPDYATETWKRGRAAAQRAIKLDSTLAEAHASLACVKAYFEGDWEGAERSFKHANTLNPNLAMSHFNYAWYLVLHGRMEEAFRENQLAKELDPLMTIYTADLGSLYYWNGQFDKAIVEVENALEIDPNFGHAWWMLGNVYTQKGWYQQAIDAHLKAIKINPTWTWALCHTYFIAGQKEKAMKILEELRANEITPRTAFGLAMIYTTLGDLDEAFYWLNHKPQDTWVPWVRTWPDFEPLRKDPRFNVFLEEKNLPPI